MKTRDRQSFWRHFRRGRPARLNLENVLGTSLELQLVVDDAGTARRAESVVLEEIDRLSAILNQHTGASELARWQTTLDCDAVVSPELADVLASANRWCDLTRGAFHPARSRCDHCLPTKTLAAQFSSACGTRYGRSMRIAASPVGCRRCRCRSTGSRRVTSSPALRRARRDVVGVSRGAAEHRRRHSALRLEPVLVGVADPASRRRERRSARHRAAAERGARDERRLSARLRCCDGEWQSHIVDPRIGQARARHRQRIGDRARLCDSADALSTAFSVLDAARIARASRNRCLESAV